MTQIVISVRVCGGGGDKSHLYVHMYYIMLGNDEVQHIPFIKCRSIMNIMNIIILIVSSLIWLCQSIDDMGRFKLGEGLRGL